MPAISTIRSAAWGMNGGIPDAMNLGEKLTACGTARRFETMGRYDRQRRKVAIERVQAQACATARILNEKDRRRAAPYHDGVAQHRG